MAGGESVGVDEIDDGIRMTKVCLHIAGWATRVAPPTIAADEMRRAASTNVAWAMIEGL
jgi:hypothetical protein